MLYCFSYLPKSFLIKNFLRFWPRKMIKNRVYTVCIVLSHRYNFYQPVQLYNCMSDVDLKLCILWITPICIINNYIILRFTIVVISCSMFYVSGILRIRAACECVRVVDLIRQLFTCFIGFILFILCKKQFGTVWFLNARTR